MRLRFNMELVEKSDYLIVPGRYKHLAGEPAGPIAFVAAFHFLIW